MENSYDSSERGPGDLILFALGFIGFVLGAGGVAAASAATAIIGWLLMLFAVVCFLRA